MKKNSLVLNEAISIPYVLNKLFINDKNEYKSIAQLINKKKIRYVVTIARGTSDCAALFSSYLFAKYCSLPTYTLPPSIITIEKSKFDFSQALVLVISQSGMGKDLIECEKQVRRMGAKTIVICNNQNSPIVKRANFFLDIHAGKEKSIAATKSFVMSIAIIIKLIFNVIKINNINDEILKLSEFLIEDEFNQWNANKITKKTSHGYIISRGIGHALANEFSLKFKELCYELIEPFSSAEVLHGPKILIEKSFKLFILQMNDKTGKHVINNSREIIRYTNLNYLISSNKNRNTLFKFKANKKYDVLDSISIMTKFYPWIVNYSFKKGLNPDKPRYLSKVTQTF